MSTPAKRTIPVDAVKEALRTIEEALGLDTTPAVAAPSGPASGDGDAGEPVAVPTEEELADRQYVIGRKIGISFGGYGFPVRDVGRLLEGLPDASAADGNDWAADIATALGTTGSGGRASP